MAADSESRSRYRQRLKLFLRDSPEMNRLTKEYDFSKKELDLALDNAVDEWNFTPPPIGVVTIDSHPAPFLLIVGAAIWACTSDAIREARNPFVFSDGGASAQQQAKPQIYESAIAAMRVKHDNAIISYKIAQNCDAAWGGAFSEYWYVPRI